MIDKGKPGTRVLFTGNEAIARGALEAGVRFCSSYPGSPVVEAAEALFGLSDKRLYGEWSVNEKVAMEAAAAASLSGLRSMAVFKHNGAAVASDFFFSLSYTGIRAGFVVVIGDDPSAHSSINEIDSRHIARQADVPMLEPASIAEARDMTRWAFELSEETGSFVIMRAVTRIAHARGNLILGHIEPPRGLPHFARDDRFICFGKHTEVHRRLAKAKVLFEKSDFNMYFGPENAPLVIIASGPTVQYAREAIKILGLEDKVGLLKLGTTWPLPNDFILKHVRNAEQIVYFEETDSFLEQNVTSMLAQFGTKRYKYFGQSSGHIEGEQGIGLGEMSPDKVVAGLSRVLNIKNPLKSLAAFDAKEEIAGMIPVRDNAMCPGCPHRSSFWAINAALELDGREGFVLGDIGCYTMGSFKAGNYLLRSVHSMGSGIGLANGFGQLYRFGFKQPVVAVAGDSTFFHACIPALVNARYNDADFTLIVLDNETTAMTGFQPHPGTGFNSCGDKVEKVLIEDITRGLGITAVVADPHKLNEVIKILYTLFKKKGPKVLILHKPCALRAARLERREFAVDQEKCIGDLCGCSRFCSRAFGCPAIFFDEEKGKAYISDAQCNGCGACVELCPRGAIFEIKNNYEW